MTRQRIRRGVFRSIADLQAAINAYLAEHNANPKPCLDPIRPSHHGQTRTLPCNVRFIQCTLMSAFARCRRVNSWLASKRWFWALPGRAGGAVVETTVDHTLMRGSEPHDR
jgi:hypothetical protein